MRGTKHLCSLVNIPGLPNENSPAGREASWRVASSKEVLVSFHMEHSPVTSATAQRFMKKSLEIPRAETESDVGSSIQMLEELVKLQRLYDIQPKPIEQQLVL